MNKNLLSGVYINYMSSNIIQFLLTEKSTKNYIHIQLYTQAL